MSKPYGIKGVEGNMGNILKSFESLGIENNIERELRKIRRAKAYAWFSLGAAAGIVITYIILKLL